MVAEVLFVLFEPKEASGAVDTESSVEEREEKISFEETEEPNEEFPDSWGAAQPEKSIEAESMLLAKSPTDARNKSIKNLFSDLFDDIILNL